MEHSKDFVDNRSELGSGNSVIQASSDGNSFIPPPESGEHVPVAPVELQTQGNRIVTSEISNVPTELLVARPPPTQMRSTPVGGQNPPIAPGIELRSDPMGRRMQPGQNNAAHTWAMNHRHGEDDYT